MSQWQGPPQGWQPPYPQQEPGYGPGYGMPGFPPPPPPRNSSAGIFWALGIAGLVLVIAVAAGAVFLVSKGDDKSEEPPRSLAQTTSVPTPTGTPTTSRPTDTPTTSTGSGVPNILDATVKTAWGETYTRTLTRGGSCPSVANSALRTALGAHPCVAPISSALYKTADRSVQVTITIMKFGSSAAASSILHAANGKAQPSLIAQPRPGVGEWFYNHSQGPYVIFSYACKSNGGAPGTRSGPVNVAAVHLGTELTNVMIWEN
jgi:hypothetical protein